jgi:hypothetical protein
MSRGRRRRFKILWRAILAVFLAAGTITSILGAVHLLDLATTAKQSQGSSYKPQMMVITNERHIAVELQISYWGGFDASIGNIALTGGRSGSLPIGIRYISIDFSGGRPGSLLQYAVILNEDANEADVTGEQIVGPTGGRENPISVGRPGGQIAGNCQLPENTTFGQVLYGSTQVAADGSGATSIVGKLANQHAYLTSGQNDIVNVMELLPTTAGMLSAGTGGECAWNMPDWPYLGGVEWYSPIALSGYLDIGALASKYSVESSEPALEDLSTLYWDLGGPTAINYILIDDAIVRGQGDDLFWAGVLAALGAGLLIESIKSAFEVWGRIREERDVQEPESNPSPILIKRKVRPDFMTVLEVATITTIIRSIWKWLSPNRD